MGGRSDGGRRTALRPSTPGASTLLGLGATFGVMVGLGVFLGVLADDAAGTSPLLALVGTLVGILVGAAGAYQVIRPYVHNEQPPDQPTRISQPGPRKG